MNKNNYRPFKNIYEFIKEQDNHRAAWTVKNKNGYYFLVQTVLDVNWAQLDSEDFWKHCFESYYWADGAPFGIKNK